MATKRYLTIAGASLVIVYFMVGMVMAKEKQFVELPAPSQAGHYSLEQLLQQRRSTREYKAEPLSLVETGQLLWAAQGITHPHGLRTAPSAGALYPLELYVVAGDVTGLDPGIYHYQTKQHRLTLHMPGDLRESLGEVAYMQTWLSEAPLIFVFTADYQRTSKKYGERARRYVHIEVGHAAQNLFLQAEDLGLGTVVVGAFHDDKVADLLQLPAELAPLVLMPVGKK